MLDVVNGATGFELTRGFTATEFCREFTCTVSKES